MTAYSVACLAGDGIGPEVMAQASRALDGGRSPPRFSVDEEHVPVRRRREDAVRPPVPAPPRAAPRSRRTRSSPPRSSAGCCGRSRPSSTCGRRCMRVAARRTDAVTFLAPLGADDRDWTLGACASRRPRARAGAASPSSTATTAGPGRRRPTPTAAGSRSSLSRPGRRSARSRRRRSSSTSSSATRRCSSPLAELAWCDDRAPRRRLGPPGRARPGHLRRRATARRSTSPARASPTRARCCSRPR